MIDKIELRIGNWFYDGMVDRDDKLIPATVKAIPAYVPEDTYLEPIPITEEWLTKLSFEGVYKRRFKHVEDTVLTMYFQNGQFTIQDYDWFELKMPHIKSIHQVQNLYFSLTGKELKLNK